MFMLTDHPTVSHRVSWNNEVSKLLVCRNRKWETPRGVCFMWMKKTNKW